MMRVFALLGVLLSAGTLFAAEPVVLKLEVWGTSTKAEKLLLYVGFTNGLFAGAAHPWRSDATPSRQLLVCLMDDDHHPGAAQAIAMIDKYYQDTPGKWDVSLGLAIVEALMAEDGPCARFKGTEPKAKSAR
jgi:hypothetical protein